jgi:hypothetical protein
VSEDCEDLVLADRKVHFVDSSVPIELFGKCF